MENNFSVYNNTLRFHVRAASDGEKEQKEKLIVRDAVLAGIKEEVEKASGPTDLEKRLEDRKDVIKNTAEKSLNRREAIRVYFTTERFPLRRYGKVLFPAGTYRALRVDIGEAKGHNWWCAIYPKLCYEPSEEEKNSLGSDFSDMFRMAKRFAKRFSFRIK
ncbi:MAG: stage II sporulation protein R [Eubacterium sp.]|nr:stage II sporulation protein R [Eubacterium sp.]MDD7208947.1 stage II sporulation protein R [Lachnospiraceae bacterium]MDY5496596.1 stage II sporulation protein R [Anaerobutyricum sp.]